VAYATEEIGSEAKTGSASHFGSSVSPSCWLRSARPTRSRLIPAGMLMVDPFASGRAAEEASSSGTFLTVGRRIRRARQRDVKS
jgi:hypothetical protein